jgi:hypothetical protein
MIRSRGPPDQLRIERGLLNGEGKMNLPTLQEIDQLKRKVLAAIADGGARHVNDLGHATEFLLSDLSEKVATSEFAFGEAIRTLVAEGLGESSDGKLSLTLKGWRYVDGLRNPSGGDGEYLPFLRGETTIRPVGKIEVTIF